MSRRTYLSVMHVHMNFSLQEVRRGSAILSNENFLSEDLIAPIRDGRRKLPDVGL